MGEYDGSLEAEFSTARGICMAETGKCLMLTVTQEKCVPKLTNLTSN